MFDRSFLEFREKINTVIVGRRCCFTTMKLGTYRMPRPELLYGFFAIKSEWNLNCESIVDYITYGGNSGLGSMELNTLGKKHQDNCQLICIMPVSHACRSVSLLVLPWAFWFCREVFVISVTVVDHRTWGTLAAPALREPLPKRERERDWAPTVFEPTPFKVENIIFMSYFKYV